VEAHLETWQWALAGLGAFLIGLSKTGIGGIGILAVTIFSSVFPARGSVGLVLVLLICADVVAVTAFRRHAVWSHLWPLFPWTIAGVLLGYFAMGRVDDLQVRKMIGSILVLLVSVQFRQYFKGTQERERIARHGLLYIALMGLAAGFTTMVANAAGPIMILYLLAAGLPKMEFVGTGAWYFLLMNCFKVPFSWKLGLINPASLSVDLMLAPLAVAGALSGRKLLPYIDQRLFEGLALSTTFLAALRLVF
jgi:uncharacterized membrane protein YfcA